MKSAPEMSHSLTAEAHKHDNIPHHAELVAAVMRNNIAHTQFGVFILHYNSFESNVHTVALG